MIQFGRLLSFPLTFKNLEPKLRELTLSKIDAVESDGTITVDADVNGHQVQLLLGTPLIDVSSSVKCYCSCDFFKYNLAYSLYKVNSLLYPEMFVLKPPKEKNTSLTLSGCKHIILVSRTLYQNRKLIQPKSLKELI